MGTWIRAPEDQGAQHAVDPDEAPLDLYVPLFDLLFGSLVETDTK